MPSALNNALFPIGYEPWYVFDITIATATVAFDKFDFMTPALGKYVRAINDAVVVTGYVVVLEAYKSGQTTYAACMPGSLVPGVAGGAIQPGGLVTIELDGSEGQRVLAAAAGDIVAGKVVGRYRAKKVGRKLLTAAAKDEIIEIQTGVI